MRQFKPCIFHNKEEQKIISHKPLIKLKNNGPQLVVPECENSTPNKEKYLWNPLWTFPISQIIFEPYIPYSINERNILGLTMKRLNSSPKKFQMQVTKLNQNPNIPSFFCFFFYIYGPSWYKLCVLLLYPHTGWIMILIMKKLCRTSSY